MSRRLAPKDFLAPLLVWALALTGCVIGEVRPTHSRLADACAAAASACLTPCASTP